VKGSYQKAFMSNTLIVEKQKTFAEIALPLAELGIPVFPLSEGTKVPPEGFHFLAEATTDPRRIDQWNTQDPNFNVGILARLDGYCFLEFDIKNGMRAACSEMGQEMPQTRAQRSGRGYSHFIFKHTDRSRTIVNRSVNLLEACSCTERDRECGCSASPELHHHHEWFSFRGNNKYLVGAGSLHPETRKRYETAWDLEPTPIPDWVCDWIEKHSKASRNKPKNARPVADDFDIDDLLEFYGIKKVDVDGPWVIVECPGVCRKHAASKRTAFWSDGETFGWSCFAQSCPCFGHSGMGMNVSGLIKYLNEQKGEPYLGPIWDYESTGELLDTFDAEEADTIIEAIAVTQPLIQGSEAVCSLCHRTKEDGCLCGAFSNGQEVPKPKKCHRDNCSCRLEHMKYEQLVPKVSEDVPEPEAVVTGPSAYVTLPFGSMPEACMYGYLGRVARKLDAPLGYAYPALLAIYASRHIGIATKTIRQNIFVVMLGDTSTGKTRSMNRALNVVGSDSVSKIIDDAIASGEGLVEKLGGKKDSQLQPLDRVGLPVLLHQDEMRELMAKIGVENSSIPYKLNRLWEKDDIGTTAKKNILKAYANASFLGGLTIESPAEFAALFGMATVSGLYVRFIYAWAPEGHVFDDIWEEAELVPQEIHPPCKNVKVPRLIFEMKMEWEHRNPKVRGQRLAQLALRIALVTAAANGDQEVTEECMKAALLFCEWQEVLRSVYKPGRAESAGGKLSEAIMNEAWRYVDDAGHYTWFNWREAYRRNHWEREDGVALGKQRDSLVKNGLLIKEDDPEHSKRTRFRAAQWSK
jgi:hypothetical protein